MQAGRLRTILTIQEKIRKPDGQGGFSEIWTEVCRVYGRIKKIGGDTDLEAGQRQVSKKIEWETRYNSNIKTDMRIVVGEETHEILAVFDPSGKRERLLITSEAKRYD